jgi:prolyl oligopeptidase
VEAQAESRLVGPSLIALICLAWRSLWLALWTPFRSEVAANGPPNIPEFGTVQDEEGFRALREMSTYDHVREGTAYPTILLYHGYNDPRVDVWMSAKAGARFQAATTSGKPVLLDIDYESGHGIGNTRSQNVRRTTDLLSVMLWQFGDPEFQPADKFKSVKDE